MGRSVRQMGLLQEHPHGRRGLADLSIRSEKRAVDLEYVFVELVFNEYYGRGTAVPFFGQNDSDCRALGLQSRFGDKTLGIRVV